MDSSTGTRRDVHPLGVCFSFDHVYRQPLTLARSSTWYEVITYKGLVSDKDVASEEHKRKAETEDGIKAAKKAKAAPKPKQGDAEEADNAPSSIARPMKIKLEIFVRLCMPMASN